MYLYVFEKASQLCHVIMLAKCLKLSLNIIGTSGLEIRNFENLVSAHVVYVIAKLVISRPCKDVKDCNMNKK